MASTNLTTGNVKKTMMLFVLPYLLSSFLQTFYGLADMFVVGLYNESETTTAVAIGSQVTHMLTVMIVGLAMGTTVEIARAIGANNKREAATATGTSITFFACVAVVLTLGLSLLVNPITRVMMTPPEAVVETARYLRICFFGLPLIIAYNVISSIYRGAGDSRSPMVFVGIACVINIILDFVLVGTFGMGASGAALATVIAQGLSVVIALVHMRRGSIDFGLSRSDLRVRRSMLRAVNAVGVPIALQDGLIQIAFIVITVIANSRGLVVSSAVGVVEKLICFMFLVPSAFLSAISAITAQNMGAGKPERARESLRFGLIITVSWGALCFILSQIIPGTLVSIFRSESDIVAAGSQYLMAYSIDCMLAAVHFCFSGYFSGDRKSIVSFIHNILSVSLIRVPGAYLASRFFPHTLYPMGLAAPIGSLFSAIVCICVYYHYKKAALK